MMFAREKYVGCVKRTSGVWRCVSRTLLPLLATAVFGGCSGGDGGLERVVVGGAVSYNGQPIPNGEIRFIPTAGTKGPVSGSAIKDGQYRADGLGGVPAGKHRVELSAFRTNKNVPPTKFDHERPVEQYLPAKFNSQSNMEAMIESGRSKKTLNFELKD